MSSKMKTIIGTAAFVLFIVIAVFGYNLLKDKVSPKSNIDITSSKSEVSQPQKDKAPDFTVIDKDGKSVKLSEMRGKPVVINFWASWCPPCKAELPYFEKVSKELGSDVTFMMVDLVDGQRETKDIGARYVNDQGFSFPIYFDTKQEGSNVYVQRYIPVTFFIDKDGYIVTSNEGGIDEKTLRKGIDLIK